MNVVGSIAAENVTVTGWVTAVVPGWGVTGEIDEPWAAGTTVKVPVSVVVVGAGGVPDAWKTRQLRAASEKSDDLECHILRGGTGVQQARLDLEECIAGIAELALAAVP